MGVMEGSFSSRASDEAVAARPPLLTSRPHIPAAPPPLAPVVIILTCTRQEERVPPLAPPVGGRYIRLSALLDDEEPLLGTLLTSRRDPHLVIPSSPCSPRPAMSAASRPRVPPDTTSEIWKKEETERKMEWEQEKLREEGEETILVRWSRTTSSTFPSKPAMTTFLSNSNLQEQGMQQRDPCTKIFLAI